MISVCARRAAWAWVAVAFATAGCATQSKPAGMASTGAVRPPADGARAVPLFDSETGVALSWEGLLDRIAAADVVIVGEMHDDARGHAVSLALAEDLLAAHPASAISLEMLDRSQQGFAEAYVNGAITRTSFIEVTQVHGRDAWEAAYQPLLDAARLGGGRVVAANAPRPYARLARLEGYEALRSVQSPPRQFAVPRTADPAYFARFTDAMAHHDPVSPPGDEMVAPWSPVDVEGMFRGQQVWDATMADSIAAAHRAGAPKVLHLVGQFHSDFNGGLLHELRALAPRIRILTLSLQPVEAAALRKEDAARADVVAYTGIPEPEPQVAWRMSR